ncbi:MAG: hypothetical protein ACI35P_01325 [Bacillus sp. (in: firmicutes)]
MKKRFNPYNSPTWFNNIKMLCAPFIVPICIFQGIRTLFFPTIFDVLLLIVLIGLTVSIRFNAF